MCDFLATPILKIEVVVKSQGGQRDVPAALSEWCYIKTCKK